MQIAIALLTCIGAGVVGGVFFAFSTFVMKALAQLPVHQGVAAMQRINVVVLNPLFLGAFLGTALLSVACLLMSVWGWGSASASLLLASGLLYLGGSFLVTVGLNVPRNERLARLAPESPQAAEYWLVYLREWSFWNHVRSAASLASAVCAAGALAV
jgi:uncharacterized membrane protein